MPSNIDAAKTRRTDRPDGRKQMLVYLRPKVIHRIKVLSAVEQRHAYEVVESILERYLDEHPELPGNGPDGSTP